MSLERVWHSTLLTTGVRSSWFEAGLGQGDSSANLDKSSRVQLWHRVVTRLN